MASTTSVEAAIEAAVPERRHAPGADAPLAIEVRGLDKTFRIPKNRMTSLKERAVHPLARPDYYELRALREISFDVRRGEFFGIVGRNGSGKSTLLKILGSIYKADAGTIRMAGRPAPFIELGVGFDPELTARENVALNGVMMGLSRADARNRLDSVLEFAELEDFIDLKLKNYSSGMLVRLAFSVMIHAPASDILLIDEVLAVGDASFQQKCADVFHEMRGSGRTIVLVTHDMGAVETYCDRAMLIHDGDIVLLGDPEEVGKEYLRLNFEGADASLPREEGMVPDRHAHLVDAWLEGDDGERVTTLEMGKKMRLHATIEAREHMHEAAFGFYVTHPDNIPVFGFNHTLEDERGDPRALETGERVRISCTVENRLVPGRYFVKCWVVRDRGDGQRALQPLDVLDFVVFGKQDATGLVSLPVEVSSEVEEGPER